MVKKIIAADIDGTLLPYGQRYIDPKLYWLIKKLFEKDILFVPASGRTIQSLEEHFKPVKDMVSYLSENGCVVWNQGKVIAKTEMPKKLTREIVDEIMRNPELEGYLTTGLKSYVLATDPIHRKELGREFAYSTIISSLDEIPKPLVKATALCYPFADAHFPYLREMFGSRVNVAKAGPEVVDFTVGNKGLGLKKLSEYLGVKPSDVYVFGDNYNDVPMFKFAGHSYLVETDDPELQASAKKMIKSPIAEIERLYNSF